MPSFYSPVLITVYDRLEHLKKCIESLKKCDGSNETALYIASDAAYKPEDFDRVCLVRDYINNIEGFKKVVLLAREENIGAVENYKMAKEQVFENNDKLIFLEDDVIVGRGFLSFINKGLDKYKGTPEVVGVCAYLPPGVKLDSAEATFLKSRSPYGFGIWRDKERILNGKQNVSYIKECFGSIQFFYMYEKNNPQVARSVPNLVRTGRFYADIVTSVIMQRENWLAIYPPVSLSKTIGNDGTGLHAGMNKRLLQQEVSNDCFKIDFIKKPIANDAAQSMRARYYRRVYSKLINYTSYFVYRVSGRYFPLDKVGLTLYKSIKEKAFKKC